ncbi:MAG: hypothetical protein WCT29_01715 [Candidatus Paceibacterota bacterium]|jgi:hypothetical protein
MKKYLKFLPYPAAFAFIITPLGNLQNPISACDAFPGLGGLICKFHSLLNSVIPVLIALGVVYFLWGIIRYVIADGEEAKSKGRDQIIYGLIGFAVIIGLWGLVNIVVTTFNLRAYAPELAPLKVGNTGSSTCEIGNDSSLKDVLCYVTRLINDSFIPLIFAVATVVFIWGAIKFFIINADEEAKREQGKQFMIWGIVALTVMLSIWGLVAILTETFGIGGPVLPQVCPPAGCPPSQ